MKCVKKDDLIKRVSDKYASELVDKGWFYVSKKEWKVVRDANKVAITVEPVMVVKTTEDPIAKPKKVPGRKPRQEEKKRSQM